VEAFTRAHQCAGLDLPVSKQPFISQFDNGRPEYATSMFSSKNDRESCLM
jgi:hypothetical protein